MAVMLNPGLVSLLTFAKYCYCLCTFTLMCKYDSIVAQSLMIMKQTANIKIWSECLYNSQWTRSTHVSATGFAIASKISSCLDVWSKTFWNLHKKKRKKKTCFEKPHLITTKHIFSFRLWLEKTSKYNNSSVWLLLESSLYRFDPSLVAKHPLGM